ncbi:unnamed protein product [Phaedon cochleariae]|uniref:J domain-containing protein n=1 Tax=Phaedon cochleariae TaxID=80249 RepID=A0A9P0GPS6_PHACE|nr:unnamed protein product [Phaedon cochleariae]
MHPHFKKLDSFIFHPNRYFNNIPNLQNYPIFHFGNNYCSSIIKGSSACWKCGAEWSRPSELFCGKCQVLQHPIQKENYFKLFGIEEKFDIDQTFLKNKFRNLQSLVHPDKFENKTHEEQTISEEYSSLANKAFSILQPSLNRAEHLLALKGHVMGKIDTVDDSSFLMEIMTLNEEIEEAGDNEEKLKVLEEKNKKMLEKLLEEISSHFKNDDLERVKKSIIKLKYFTSINGRLNSIFREMGVTN